MTEQEALFEMLERQAVIAGSSVRQADALESIAESLSMLVQQTGEREAWRQIGRYMTGEASGPSCLAEEEWLEKKAGESMGDIVDRIRVDES